MGEGPRGPDDPVDERRRLHRDAARGARRGGARERTERARQAGPFAGTAARQAEPLLRVVPDPGELQPRPVAPVGHRREHLSELRLQFVFEAHQRAQLPVESDRVAAPGRRLHGREPRQERTALRRAGERLRQPRPRVRRAAERRLHVRLGRAVLERREQLRAHVEPARLRLAHERLDEVGDRHAAPLNRAVQLERLLEGREHRGRHRQTHQHPIGIRIVGVCSRDVGSVFHRARAGAPGTRLGQTRSPNRRTELPHAQPPREGDPPVVSRRCPRARFGGWHH